MVTCKAWKLYKAGGGIARERQVCTSCIPALQWRVARHGRRRCTRLLKQFGADGPERVRQAIADSREIGKDGEPEEKIDFGIITAAELLRKDCSVEFLIPHVLAKGQHHILAAH